MVRPFYRYFGLFAAGKKKAAASLHIAPAGLGPGNNDLKDYE